jgi:hypothetical protein
VEWERWEIYTTKLYSGNKNKGDHFGYLGVDFKIRVIIKWILNERCVGVGRIHLSQNRVQ